MARTAAQNQTRLWAGGAKIARALGGPVGVYRPSGPVDPLDAGNLQGTVQAAFSVDGEFSRANGYGKATWTAWLDGSQVRPGDYLVEQAGLAPRTFFVAAMQPALPILAVECNRMVAVRRPRAAATGSGFGAQPYAGDTETHAPPLLSGWPASILQGSKGERSEAGLPDDTRLPWCAVLLPAVPGVVIETSDVITDDLGRRYKVSGAEASGLGWRLSAMLAET